jgi:phosphoesterase RecJ-like protein
MELGVNLPSVYQQALSRRSFQAARFWGSGLSGLQRDGRMVWTTLTMEARREAGYNGRDDADLVNILSSINDVDVAVIFVEQPGGDVKISWRALTGIDVAQIAQTFGGGGHRAAAGAILPGPLSAVQGMVLRTTRDLLAEIAKEGA